MRKNLIKTYSYYKFLQDIANTPDTMNTQPYYFSNKDFVFYDVFIYIQRYNNNPFRLVLNFCHKDQSKRISFSNSYTDLVLDLDLYLDFQCLLFDSEILLLSDFIDFLKGRYKQFLDVYNDLVELDYNKYREYYGQ